MSIIKKVAIVVSVVVLIAIVIYQRRQVASLQQEVAKLDARVVKSAASNRERSSATTKLDALIEENRRLREKAAAGAQDDATSKIAALKELLTQLPEQGIPELQFATDADWRDAVDGKLETADDFRVALAKVRNSATRRFAGMLRPALQSYLAANNGQFPSDPAQLAAFFQGSLDPTLLPHYKVVPAKEVNSVKVGGTLAITQINVVDPLRDLHFVVGSNGFGAYKHSPDRALVESVLDAYAVANGGTRPADMSQALPYATTPEQRAAFDKIAQSGKR